MPTMEEWIAQNYPGYDPNGGVTTVMGGGVDPVTGRRQPTMTHTGSTPETHPWMYGNDTDVDINGKVYYNPDGTAITQSTGQGWNAGRVASDAERLASNTSKNYFLNGGKGLDPNLMKGMTTTDPRGDRFRNQYGTYMRQRSIIDPARKAAGLDPWVERASSFSGRDMQGKPLDWTNTRGVWGNRGPGFQGGQSQSLSSILSQALRNRSTSSNGVTPPPAGGTSTPGGGTLPGNGSLPGTGTQIGLPPGHSSFGGAGGEKQPGSTPQWWLDMQQRMPGKTPGAL